MRCGGLSRGRSIHRLVFVFDVSRFWVVGCSAQATVTYGWALHSRSILLIVQYFNLILLLAQRLYFSHVVDALFDWCFQTFCLSCQNFCLAFAITERLRLFHLIAHRLRVSHFVGVPFHSCLTMLWMSFRLTRGCALLCYSF